jgi:demethylmenaquinone methyltransferase/2-methoxy-6-polyprenyl-1,4-benzoquinol methylase
LALAYDKAARGVVPIMGTDFCLPMLLPARQKARRRGASDRVQFLEADTQKLPFADDTFQLTTVAFGLRNVTDTDRGIAEMVRVTQPGGRVAILEFSQPRHWLFGRLYRFYFRYLLPAIGQFVSRSKDNAYRYLPASVMEFPDGEALANRLRGHGLVEVQWYPLTFGIATLYVGTKRGVGEVGFMDAR